MLGKILNLSAFALLIGVVACDKKTAGITEEGNSLAQFDVWNGANGVARLSDVNGSVGHWFSVSDEEDGGTSTIKFPTVSGTALTLDSMESLVAKCAGLCGTVELGESSAPSAGVGIALSEKESAIDISGWDGLCVSYESELPMKGVLGYQDGDSVSSDDLPSVDFEKTGSGANASRCAKWADFKQKSLNNHSGVVASKKATSLIFKFFGKAKESGYFNIKGVSSYKHGVENLDSIKTVEEPRIDDLGACLWNGTANAPGSFVSNDSNDVTGGFWYSYNDRADGGGSLLYWSADAPNYRNAVEWLTDDELFTGGLMARVTLDKGNASQAYAGVGLKMVVRDSATAEYSAKAVDISGWGGICVYYMAEKDMRFILASDSQKIEQTLEASTDPARKCFTWDALASSGLEKSASDIKFEARSDENVYTQIRFNIIAIGRYSAYESCYLEASGIDSIAKE